MTRWPNADQRARMGLCAERARNNIIPARPDPDPAPLLCAIPLTALVLIAVGGLGLLLVAVLLTGLVAGCHGLNVHHHDQAAQITRRNR